MRKACSMVMMIALLVVSSIPMLPAAAAHAAETYCPLCHMQTMDMTQMQRTQHARQVMTPAMRHARIEYCGHHDIDGLPHLLAPHVVSLSSLESYLVIADALDASVSTLKPRLLPFPVPPPKTS